MTAALQTSADDRETASRFPIFIFWIAVQVVALALARSNVQITGAGHHAAGWSAEILLIAQIGMAALLFWDLFSSLRLAALAFAISFPLTQLAAAGQPDRLLLATRCFFILLLWLAGLWGWRFAVLFPRISVPLMAVWVWGGAGMWYLAAEFASDSRAVDVLFATNPLLQCTRIAGWSPLLLFVIHAAAGLLAAVIAHLVARRAGHRPG